MESLTRPHDNLSPSFAGHQAALFSLFRLCFLTPAMRRWILALFDQAVVSGTRFVATIIVGRMAGADELGHYSIAFSGVIFLGCFQEALVTTPYAIHFHRLRARSRAAYSGGALLIHTIVALSGGLLLALSAGVNWLAGGEWVWTALALTVAATTPFSLMWEFARRSLLAQLRLGAAVRIDLIAASLQVALLVYFANAQMLTAATALFAMAVGSLSAALVWRHQSRSSRSIQIKLLGLYWQRNWQLGKWLVAGQLIGSLHGAIPSLLLALLTTATATGVFAAYFNIALVANPLILAVCNFLTSRTAQAFKEEGPRAVLRVVRSTAIVLSGVLALFVTTLAICGERIVRLVYGGEYVGHGAMLVVLACCLVCWSISATCACGLAALRYPRGGFIASMIGMAVSTIAILLLVPTWSIMGAAVGSLTGAAVAAATHVVIFTEQCRSLTAATRTAERVQTAAPNLKDVVLTESA